MSELAGVFSEYEEEPIIKKNIELLDGRRDEIVFSHKITTQQPTAMDFEYAIAQIDEKLKQLRSQLKTNQ